jgi:hypothetical protein
MSKITKELNSKQWTSGNMDVWWYNISSPSKLKKQDIIRLNLWDAVNQELVKEVILDLEKNWLQRIRQASTHFFKGREICKIHIEKRHGTNQFFIYFGRKDDGIYPLP